MAKKTTYFITLKKGQGLYDAVDTRKFSSIVRARKFISANLDSVLSCWRDTKHHGKSVTRRVFRSIAEGEPKEYYNNEIKAKR